MIDDSWSRMQLVKFLTYLPFVRETWERAGRFLGTDEGEYWESVPVAPFEAAGQASLAIDKLLQYGRPFAAIKCLDAENFKTKRLDIQRAVNALLAAVNSDEPDYLLDSYEVGKIIEQLQADPRVDPQDLFRIEWSYLPILDGIIGGSPKHLNTQLASALCANMRETLSPLQFSV